MGNIIEKIKKMFLNRNSVTILGVIAGVIVLWVVYSMTLDKAVSPVKVPVANKDITAGTMITKEDIDYVEINSEVLKKATILTTSSQLIGYYVNNGTSITKGAMFYKDQVVDKSKLIERDLETIPEGQTIYQLKVDNTSTYANSIYPKDRIDLWLKGTMDGQIFYEEFITSIEVLGVKDSKGQNVFDVSDGNRTPAYLTFAVDVDMFQYLKRVELLSQLQLYPVPRNKMYTTEQAETKYANEQLKVYIDSLSRFTENKTTE